jgi:ribose transport system permease protein
MTDAPPIPARRRFDWRSAIETFGPLLALAVLVAVTAGSEKALTGEQNFLKPENLLNILRQWSFIGMLAIGMTVVIIGGGIDLSVGSLLALAGGLGLWVMNTAVNAQQLISANALAVKSHQEDLSLGLSLPLTLPNSPARIGIARALEHLHLAGSAEWGIALAIATMLLIGTVGGWLVGILVAKGRIAPFITTLGFLAIDRSLVMSLADGSTINSTGDPTFAAMGAGGITLGKTAGGVSLLIGWPVVVFVVMAIVVAYLLARTRFGRYVYAIGSNERAAVYSAVNVDRVKILTYTLMGLITGVAAVFLASYFTAVTTSSTGNLYELDAIAAVVIGGTRLSGGSGTVRGTVVGVLILGVVSNMLSILNVSPYLQGTVKGSIIIAAVLLQQVGRKQ